MPNVSCIRDELFSLLGKEYTDQEFDCLLQNYGMELDDVVMEPERHSQQLVKTFKIDVGANRPDLLCVEGIARALAVFIGSANIQKLQISPPLLKIVVSQQLREFRPFVVAAIIKNVKFTNRSYNSFIDHQDKLHLNVCRRRTLAAIGTHDLRKICIQGGGIIRYNAELPENIVFQALGQGQVTNGKKLHSILSQDRKLAEYLPLLKVNEKWPVIRDSNNKILSMPPIINSEYSKIDITTTDVLIECTAVDYQRANVALNAVINGLTVHCSCSCSENCEVEAVEVVYEGGFCGSFGVGVGNDANCTNTNCADTQNNANNTNTAANNTSSTQNTNEATNSGAGVVNSGVEAQNNANYAAVIAAADAAANNAKNTAIATNSVVNDAINAANAANEAANEADAAANAADRAANIAIAANNTKNTANSGVESQNNTQTTPNLSERTMTLSINYVQSIIGIQIPISDIQQYLRKMSIQSQTLFENNNTDTNTPNQLVCTIPFTRTDILHPIDLVEDVAIGFGYNRINDEFSTYPTTSTIGKTLTEFRKCENLRVECASCGYLEQLLFSLCGVEDAIFGELPIQLKNAKTATFTHGRANLVPGLLKAAACNSSRALPLQLFECADVFVCRGACGVETQNNTINVQNALNNTSANNTDTKNTQNNTYDKIIDQPDNETNAGTQRRLAALYGDVTDGFGCLHGLLDKIAYRLGVKFELKREDSPLCIAGRRAGIYLVSGGNDNENSRRIGWIGVPAVSVLQQYKVAFPVTVFEIDVV